MGKYGRVYIVLVLVSFLAVGCKSYEQMLEDHEAIQMQNDGIWAERYRSLREDYEPGTQGERTLKLSVNVLKDMTEEEMLDVLEYHELFYNAFSQDRVYTKERDADFTCYAVFYRGDTDEVIRKFKYVNHESVTVTEEDEGYFASPILRSQLPSGM